MMLLKSNFQQIFFVNDFFFFFTFLISGFFFLDLQPNIFQQTSEFIWLKA
jgi:hypothetical protein